MIDQVIRVLSIEDNPVEAELIQEKLAEAQRVGWDLPRIEVEHVDRLEAALTRLNAGGEFDVVLSDLDLPDSRAPRCASTSPSAPPAEGGAFTPPSKLIPALGRRPSLHKPNLGDK